MKISKKILSAVTAAAMLLTLTACNYAEKTPTSSETSSSSESTSSSSEQSSSSESSSSSSSTSSTSSVVSSSSESTVSTSSETSSTSSSTTTSEKPVESSSAASSTSASVDSEPIAETKWTEKELVLYLEKIINTNGVNARIKPVPGAAVVNVYNKNEEVLVVAMTSTNYYKLEDGSYIHKDYLTGKDPLDKDTSTSSSSSSKPLGGRELYITQLIKTDRPIPINTASDQTLRLLMSRPDKPGSDQIMKDSWDLNVGDITSQGYEIIGKTPEGFGYIKEKDAANGIFIAGYLDNGKYIPVYDETLYDAYVARLQATIRS